MKIIEGDIIEIIKWSTKSTIAIHGCNCFHTMGAGVASQLSQNFPEILEIDKKTKKGDKNKLGTISYTSVNPSVIVVNLYSQYYPGNDLRIDALRKGFKKVKEIFGNHNFTIYYPKIGAGIAGGNWNEISKIIDYELQGENHILVNYNKKIFFNSF